MDKKALRAEIKEKKWLFGGIMLQLGTGFTVAFLVYQVGTLITEGTLGEAFLPGLIAVLVMLLILALVINNTEKKMKEEYKLTPQDKIETICKKMNMVSSLLEVFS